MLADLTAVFTLLGLLAGGLLLLCQGGPDGRNDESTDREGQADG